MNEPLPPISTAPEADPAFDPRALFQQGLDGVRQYSRTLWTDHNTHDPGITMLEVASYALTDLAYRHALPVEDLLLAPGETAADAAARFHAPQAVLPNRACTELDWRKLLIDLPAIKNAWLMPATDVLLYADLRQRELRRTPPDHPAFQVVPLAGLVRVRVEFMDSVNTQPEREAALAAVRAALHASRNLCEDFIDVRPVRAQYFAVCAEVDLDNTANVTETAAQLLFDIGQTLAPPVRSHTLAALQARGLTLPEVFEGPLPEHGFMADDDLQATGLPSELRLSDVVGVAMDVPGVRAVRSIVLNPIERSDEDNENAADDDPTDVQGEAVPVANPWRVPVRAGRLPRLSLNHGRLTFTQRGLPVQGWFIADMPDAVATRLAQLREAARLLVETPASSTVPVPALLQQGRARPLADWVSFQRDFPALYGIGEAGLGERATPQRRAQVLQLKAWLLFFDQLMADQLALLAQAKLRLSVAPADLQAVAQRFGAVGNNRHTLASQVVDSIVGGADVYPVGVTPRMLADATETTAEATQRQQALLDHLLARSAEDFADYSAAMASAFGADPDQLINDKCRFLQTAAPAVMHRAGAMNQRPVVVGADTGVWNTLNVSGLERRIAGLLGIRDFSRRNLGLVSYDTYNEVDQVPDSTDEYRFRVRHAVTNLILLSSSTRYATPEAAREEMILAIERGQQASGYQRGVASDGRHYFNIVNAEGEVIARRIRYYEDPAVMETAIDELITYLVGHYSGEGLYLVEHMGLRPTQPNDPLIPICTDPGCEDCSELDPYSYRVHVVLPAYAGRFVNAGFRQFVEHTIRAEMPAHILPTVCWVGTEHMAQFESAWRAWLELQMGNNPNGPSRTARLQALIDALVGVKNVYPVRALFDCTTDEAKPPFILGRTALGRGPTGVVGPDVPHPPTPPEPA